MSGKDVLRCTLRTMASLTYTAQERERRRDSVCVEIDSEAVLMLHPQNTQRLVNTYNARVHSGLVAMCNVFHAFVKVILPWHTYEYIIYFI